MAQAESNRTKKIESKLSRIPEFASVQEEAEFWDTHEFTEFWDELKPVKVRFAKNLSEGITIRLDPATTLQLRTEAAKKGIGPTTLVRMWVLERLREQERERRPGQAATAVTRQRATATMKPTTTTATDRDPVAARTRTANPRVASLKSRPRAEVARAKSHGAAVKTNARRRAPAR